MTMNQPCKGCGHPLQYTNPLVLGYSPKEGATYCQSCFRYKHYKDTTKIIKSAPEYAPMHIEGIVIWCVDAMFVEDSLKRIHRSWLEQDFIMVLSKFDVYPTSLWHHRLEQITILCQKYNIHPHYMIPFSKHMPMTKQHILEAMNATQQSVFSCIGMVNAGKSSLLNTLVDASTLVTSPFAHTTQAPCTIEWENYKLIDYPGFDPGVHPYDSLPSDIVQRIHIDGLIKPITYALKRSCVIVVNDVVWIECHLDEPSSLTLYMSAQCESHKRNLTILDDNPFDHHHEFKGSCDIEITHVGWMHAVGSSLTMILHTHPSLALKETKDALCW